ncbi:MAG: FG-GAP-like repeat-containing protein [Flavobacteriales bacterium]
MFIRFALTIILLYGYAHSVFGQYVNTTAEHFISNVNMGTIWGNGCSMYDFNHDGWDDLTIAQGSQEPQFFVNNNGVFQSISLGQFNPGNKQVKNLQWVDWDNDGDSDLFISRYNGSLLLFRNNGDLQFTDITAQSGVELLDLAYQAAAWADYNHDGFLDFYIAKYYFGPGFLTDEYASVLYKGNGNGTFTNVTIEAGIFLNPRATFQPVWFDYDNDGWQDLYLVVDRYTWTNELFRNNGNGTFTNVTASSNSLLYVNAMTGTIGDYDNDQDFDIYVTNGFDGNHLMRNNGNGTFTDVWIVAGVQVYDFCWGANWIDYDNNTMLDLFVCATGVNYGPNQNAFLVNNGDGTFHDGVIETGIAGDFGPSFCNAIGDVNNDGYYDYFNMNNQPYESDLWENTGGENHWLSIELEGTLSNRDAFGALIKMYAGGNTYVRYTHGGESYLNQNSGKEIFGLETLDYVDSLVITWPRGLQEVYYYIPADQHMHFVEGESANAPFQLLTNTAMICEGETAQVITVDADLVMWSDSTTSDTLYAESGFYRALVQTLNGNLFYTEVVEVHTYQLPEVELVAEQPSCFGLNNGSIQFENTGSVQLTSIVWDNLEANSLQAELLLPGNYTMHVTDQFGCISSYEATVEAAPQLLVLMQHTDVQCAGAADGSIIIQISNTSLADEDIQWNNELFAGDTLSGLSSGSYYYHYTDAYSCFYTDTVQIGQPEALSVLANTSDVLCNGQNTGSATLSIAGGTMPYSAQWFESDSTQLLAGSYQLVVTDAHACSYELTIKIEQPDALNAEVEITDEFEDQPGTAQVTAGGGISPYTIVWSTGAEDVWSIDDLQAGSYSVTITDANGCSVDYNFEIDFIESVKNIESNSISLYPNPSGDFIYLNMPNATWISICDVCGKLCIRTMHYPGSPVSIGELAPGQYFILTDDQRAVRLMKD